MKQKLLGGFLGFLAGGVLGGATFGPIGSLVGSILGIPIGAIVLWTVGTFGETGQNTHEPPPEAEAGRARDNPDGASSMHNP